MLSGQEESFGSPASMGNILEDEIILNPVVGQGGVCGFWSPGQGATAIPFQGTATQPCAANIAQPAL
jgi:hypothetical protein